MRTLYRQWYNSNRTLNATGAQCPDLTGHFSSGRKNRIYLIKL